MKRFLMLLMVALTSLSLLATNAEARRMGGGGTFGKQRSVAPQQAPQRAPTAAPTPAPSPNAAATPSRNKWLGPLAGLAIGAGLASMLSGTGLGGAMGSILLAVLIAAALAFIVSRFLKPKQPADLRYANAPQSFDNTASTNSTTRNWDIPSQTASGNNPGTLNPGLGDAGLGNAALGTLPTSNHAERNIAPDFPIDSFLRGAKASFIRLQAANDRKDLDDIREYTTPEIFAEISMQLMERGDAIQKTDVINLNAELLEAVTEGDLAIASVRFTCQLVENNGTPEYVDEIWVVQRNTLNSKAGWLLAGIQQTQLQ